MSHNHMLCYIIISSNNCHTIFLVERYGDDEGEAQNLRGILSNHFQPSQQQLGLHLTEVDEYSDSY